MNQIDFRIIFSSFFDLGLFQWQNGSLSGVGQRDTSLRDF
jgi:hypothetical protein